MTFPLNTILSQRQCAEGSSSIILDERVPSRLTLNLFVLKKKRRESCDSKAMQLSMVYDAVYVLPTGCNHLLSLSWGYLTAR
jgi:hypothetical protein